MGQSPHHSPRATQSPLVFVPQIPVILLQKPYEMLITNHPWMQVSSEHEDMCSEQGFPSMFTWWQGSSCGGITGQLEDRKILAEVRERVRHYESAPIFQTCKILSLKTLKAFLILDLYSLPVSRVSINVSECTRRPERSSLDTSLVGPAADKWLSPEFAIWALWW